MCRPAFLSAVNLLLHFLSRGARAPSPSRPCLRVKLQTPSVLPDNRRLANKAFPAGELHQIYLTWMSCILAPVGQQTQTHKLRSCGMLGHLSRADIDHDRVQTMDVRAFNNQPSRQINLAP